MTTCVTIPLTPVLSPRERENCIPSHERNCDRIGPTVVRRIITVALLFPLSVGESQGEGDVKHKHLDA